MDLHNAKPLDGNLYRKNYPAIWTEITVLVTHYKKNDGKVLGKFQENTLNGMFYNSLSTETELTLFVDVSQSNSDLLLLV